MRRDGRCCPLLHPLCLPLVCVAPPVNIAPTAHWFSGGQPGRLCSFMLLASRIELAFVNPLQPLISEGV